MKVPHRFQNLTKSKLDSVQNSDLFLSHENILFLIKQVRDSKNSTCETLNNVTLMDGLPQIISKWAMDNNIDDYESLGSYKIVTLDYLNTTFLEQFIDCPPGGDSNVFRKKVHIEYNDRKGQHISKDMKMEDMMPCDINNIKLASLSDTFINNKFRDKNNSLLVRSFLHSRNYELHGDGLTENSRDEAAFVPKTYSQAGPKYLE